MQPLPEAAAHAEARLRSTTRSSGCSTPGCELYDWTLRAEPALPRRHDGACRSRCSSAPVYLFTLVPKGFLPSEDQGRFNISTEGDPGHRLRRDGRATRCRWPTIVAKDPDIVELQQQRRRRAAAAAALNTGPHQRRPEAARRAQARRSIRSSPSLRPKLAQVPGIRVFMVNQPPINLGGQQGARSLYQFTLQDTDTAELYQLGADPRGEAARACPASRTSAATCRSRTRRSRSTMDRDKISALGLTVNQVETALYNAYGTRQVSQIYAPNNQYQVIMQVAPEFQQRSGGAVDALRPLDERHADPARTPSRRCTTDAGPLVGQPHRPAAVGHDFVQPQAGLRARRRGRPRSDAAAATTLPSTIVDDASRARRRRSRIRCRASA